MLSCGRGCTLGRRTTSANEESEQAAGQDKYLSAGHLPHLWSAPAAWAGPSTGTLPQGLQAPPDSTSGASSAGQTLLPAVCLSQRSSSTGSRGKGRAGGSRASRGAPGQAAVATRTQGNRNGLSTACASTFAQLPLGTGAPWG